MRGIPYVGKGTRPTESPSRDAKCDHLSAPLRRSQVNDSEIAIDTFLENSVVPQTLTQRRYNLDFVNFIF